MTNGRGADYAFECTAIPALGAAPLAMVRNAGVYVRGRVRHSDHKTIDLGVWHRVLLNTETDAPSMRHVAFLD